MITDKVLRGLKPTTDDKMQFLSDKGGMPGLGIIWGKKGVASWTLAYRTPDGKQHRTKIGFAWGGPGEHDLPQLYLSPSAARAKAYQIVEAAKQGVVTQSGMDRFDQRVASATTRKTVTLRDAIEAYLDDPNTANLRSRDEIRRRLMQAIRGREDHPVARITRQEAREMYAPLGATVTGNRTHAYLRAAFRYAVEHEMIVASPVPMDAPLRTEQTRDRVLTDCEIAKVWHATNRLVSPVIRDVVRLLILTGQRREEVAGMEWSELDIEDGTWTMGRDRSKTGAAHIIPLVPEVLAIIKAQKRIVDCPYVFTATGRRSVDMSNTGSKLKDLSGIDFHLHDLRRTARTGWSRLGVAPNIREVLIHPPTGIAGVYDRHDFLAEKRTALECWTAHVLSLTTAAE